MEMLLHGGLSEILVQWLGKLEGSFHHTTLSEVFMMHHVAILVPTHNEEEMLPHVLDAIVHSIPAYNKLSLVVSDDASRDETVAIAHRFTEHVINAEKHIGVGGATRRGLQYITKLPGINYVIKIDGDGQHDPIHISEILNILSEEKADIVCCSRFHQHSLSVSDPPLDRLILNRVMSRLVSEITGWDLTDARTGFMGFRFRDVCRVAGDLIVDGYGIPMELIIRLWKQDPLLRLREVPHPARYERGISSFLDNKYSSETAQVQSERLRVAYEAILRVLYDLEIDSGVLLRKVSEVSPSTKTLNAELYRPRYSAMP